LEKYRKLIDLAELRVDCLDPDERFLIRSFPEKAGVPVILTIRRKIDGGQYIGGEGARIVLLSKGLAFADANRRRNFAYVDIEEDLNVPSLEEGPVPSVPGSSVPITISRGLMNVWPPRSVPCAA
jgi:3-dehydroquinate dehydratase/shikimate dehydrogenase